MSPATKPTYNLLTNEDQSFITLFIPGLPPKATGDEHPSFDAIVANCVEFDRLWRAGETDAALDLAEETLDLFDVAETIARKFEALAGSERLSIKGGRIFLDGDEVSNEITDHILKMQEAGEDFTPLVRFYERLLTNPLGHAREALYPWMQGNGGLTITPTGLVVGYKIVVQEPHPETGELMFRPTRNDGGGIVNGEEFDAGEWLWQKVGDVVEMPRSIVLHEPSQACGEGLHIGTWSYSSVSGNAKLEVHFDPRDVVNVPNGANKIRVCRYIVAGTVTEPYTQPIVPDYSDPETDPEICGCGEPADECEFPDCETGDDVADTGWMGESKPTTGPSATDLGLDIPTAEDILDEVRDAAEAAAQVARDALGRWVNGRPSQRDPKTGRFVG